MSAPSQDATKLAPEQLAGSPPTERGSDVALQQLESNPAAVTPEAIAALQTQINQEAVTLQEQKATTVKKIVEGSEPAILQGADKATEEFRAGIQKSLDDLKALMQTLVKSSEKATTPAASEAVTVETTQAEQQTGKDSRLPQETVAIEKVAAPVVAEKPKEAVDEVFAQVDGWSVDTVAAQLKTSDERLGELNEALIGTQKTVEEFKVGRLPEAQWTAQENDYANLAALQIEHAKHEVAIAEIVKAQASVLLEYKQAKQPVSDDLRFALQSRWKDAAAKLETLLKTNADAAGKLEAAFGEYQKKYEMGKIEATEATEVTEATEGKEATEAAEVTEATGGKEATGEIKYELAGEEGALRGELEKLQTERGQIQARRKTQMEFFDAAYSTQFNPTEAPALRKIQTMYKQAVDVGRKFARADLDVYDTREKELSLTVEQAVLEDKLKRLEPNDPQYAETRQKLEDERQGLIEKREQATKDAKAAAESRLAMRGDLIKALAEYEKQLQEVGAYMSPGMQQMFLQTYEKLNDLAKEIKAELKTHATTDYDGYFGDLHEPSWFADQWDRGSKRDDNSRGVLDSSSGNGGGTDGKKGWLARAWDALDIKVKNPIELIKENWGDLFGKKK